MYILLTKQNTVSEIIPDENPIFPGVPIAERYAPDFVDKLQHFPDDTEVSQNWLYDPDENRFWPEGDPAAPTYSTEDMMRQLIGGAAESDGQYTDTDMMRTLATGTLPNESGGGGVIHNFSGSFASFFRRCGA